MTTQKIEQALRALVGRMREPTGMPRSQATVNSWADEIETALAALSEPAKVEGVVERICDCGHTESDHDTGSDAPCSKCSCINPVYATPAPGVAPRVDGWFRWTDMDGYERITNGLPSVQHVHPESAVVPFSVPGVAPRVEGENDATLALMFRRLRTLAQQRGFGSAHDAVITACKPAPVAAVKAVREWPKECDWHNHRQFTVWDDPDEHEPCWLVMPDGGAVKFNHHATNGVDQARAKFIADACNAALAAASPEKEKGE